MDAWAPASTVAGLWTPPPLPSGSVTLASGGDLPNEESARDTNRAAGNFATRIIRSQKAGGSIVVGGVVMIALAVLSWLGSATAGLGHRSSHRPLGATTRPKPANGLVRFPFAPQLRNLSIPIGSQSFSYERAQLFAAGEMMRAECIPIGLPASDAREMLKRQADLEGLQHSAISTGLAESVRTPRLQNDRGGRRPHMSYHLQWPNQYPHGWRRHSQRGFPTRNSDAFLLSVRPR